jgi:hypothetical protein
MGVTTLTGLALSVIWVRPIEMHSEHHWSLVTITQQSVVRGLRSLAVADEEPESDVTGHEGKDSPILVTIEWLWHAVCSAFLESKRPAFAL